MKNRLHFRTVAAANLFSTEITGQLSDGAWENTRPSDHWVYWCNAEVVVDGKAYREGFALKDNYNLFSLKKWIKEEMKDAIRITKMPWFDIKKHGSLGRTICSRYSGDRVPTCLEKREAETAEYQRKHFSFTIEKRTEDAVNAIGKNLTEEFKKLIEDEVVHQMVLESERRVAGWNDMVKQNWELLADIGVTDAEGLRQLHEQIHAVEVTDSELNAVLTEIREVMQTPACEVA